AALDHLCYRQIAIEQRSRCAAGIGLRDQPCLRKVKGALEGKELVRRNLEHLLKRQRKLRIDRRLAGNEARNGGFAYVEDDSEGPLSPDTLRHQGGDILAWGSKI